MFLYPLFYDQPVYDDVDIMPFISVQGYLFGYVDHFTVYPCADETFLPRFIQFFFVFSFSSHYDRGEDLDACSIRQGGYKFDDLLCALRSDGVIAFIAAQLSDPCIGHPQVIVDLRYSAHSGPEALCGCFWFSINGNHKSDDNPGTTFTFSLPRDKYYIEQG